MQTFDAAVSPLEAGTPVQGLGPHLIRICAEQTVGLGVFEGVFGAVGQEAPDTPEAIDADSARFHLRFVPAPAAAAAECR